MSKEYLLETISNIDSQSYYWNLYFLKINRRYKDNPYFVCKHTFKSPTFLADYITALRDIIIKYQIHPVNSIQTYDGHNSKTSCDKLRITDPLISSQWEALTTSVCDPSRQNVKGKYQGYILDGQPIHEGKPAIVIIKVANPVYDLSKKNQRIFRHTPENELEDISDELCRLYLNADFMVIEDFLYTFNQKFEDVFNLEKTIRTIKAEAIDSIMQTNAFSDPDKVRIFLESYSYPKTFLTLRTDHESKLYSKAGRREIAQKLQLKIKHNTELTIENQAEANNLIKYLCRKIIHDKDTDYLVEVNSVINENIMQTS